DVRRLGLAMESHEPTAARGRAGRPDEVAAVDLGHRVAEERRLGHPPMVPRARGTRATQRGATRLSTALPSASPRRLVTESRLESAARAGGSADRAVVEERTEMRLLN